MSDDSILKRIKYTKEGFSYVEVTPLECINWGGFCICNSCGDVNFLKNNYLVFVLGDLYCEKCFNEWKNRDKKLSQYDIDFDLKLQKENHIEFYKAHLVKS